MHKSIIFKFINITFSVSAFLFISLLLPSKILGLTCASDFIDPREKIESSKYIFVGKVLNGESGKGVDPAVVQISKKYKGRLPNDVNVKLATNWEFYQVKSGGEYLFLLDRHDSEKNTVYRVTCDYSSTVETSSKDFKTYKSILDKNERNFQSAVTTGVVVTLIIVGYILSSNLKRKNTKK